MLALAGFVKYWIEVREPVTQWRYYYQQSQ